MNLGQIRRIEWDQRIAGEPAPAEFVIEGIVAKLVVFDKIPDGIYAKAIDATTEPKRITSWMALRTAGLRQFKSGCAERNVWQ